jgi:hypothetical protein
VKMQSDECIKMYFIAIVNDIYDEHGGAIVAQTGIKIRGVAESAHGHQHHA